MLTYFNILHIFNKQVSYYYKKIQSYKKQKKHAKLNKNNQFTVNKKSCIALYISNQYILE